MPKVRHGVPDARRLKGAVLVFVLWDMATKALTPLYPVPVVRLAGAAFARRRPRRGSGDEVTLADLELRPIPQERWDAIESAARSKCH